MLTRAVDPVGRPHVVAVCLNNVMRWRHLGEDYKVVHCLFFLATPQVCPTCLGKFFRIVPTTCVCLDYSSFALSFSGVLKVSRKRVVTVGLNIILLSLLIFASQQC